MSDDGVSLGRPATMADWEAIPEPDTAHLIAGRLYPAEHPSPRHADTLGGLMVALGKRVDATKAWVLLPRVDVRVGDDIVCPDFAGWPREQRPFLVMDALITLAPAWVCEVLSPSTDTFDRSVKATWYAAAGVRWLWFVDPEDKTLEVLKNDAGVWRPVGTWRGESMVAAPPFEAAPWLLAGLWG